MNIEILKSKIHRVTVTEANLDYIGSITIDEALMEAANIIPNEKVQVVDVNNGERIETYVIKGERGSGCVCLNGPAARKVAVGDIVIIMSYASMDFEEAKSFKPAVVFPDTRTIEIVPAKRSILCTSDGDNTNHNDVTRIEITTKRNALKVLKFSDADFVSKIREKFL